MLFIYEHVETPSGKWHGNWHSERKQSRTEVAVKITASWNVLCLYITFYQPRD